MEDKKIVNNSQKSLNTKNMGTQKSEKQKVNSTSQNLSKTTSQQKKTVTTSPVQVTQKKKTEEKTVQKPVQTKKDSINTSNQTKTAPTKTESTVASKTVKSQNTKPQTSVESIKTKTQSKTSTTAKKDIEIVNDKIEKTKNEIELIGIFIKLEKNLIDVLQTIPKDVSEEGLADEKANIKSYMKKVELARKLFDEYENTAKLITTLSESKENDLESIEISKKVMEIRDGKEQKSKIDEKDLLRQVQAIEKQSKGMDKVEIEMLGDKVVVKKKKMIAKEKTM